LLGRVLIFAFLASCPVANAETKCITPINPEAALKVGVEEIYSTHSKTKYATFDGDTFESVSYSRPDDFIARNPGCCSFSLSGEDGFRPTEEWRKENSFYGFVRASFKAYRAVKGEKESEVTITQSVVVTSCGAVIWYNMDHDNW
jgi:hypothetical protein